MLTDVTPLRVLSLGAGVQSSTILLMACRGELQIEHAIFADTWEPKAVYDWLEFLKGEAGKAGIPLHVVRAKHSMKADALRLTGNGSRAISLPYYVKSDNGERVGMTGRQCTRAYKVVPIARKIRELLGLKPGARWPIAHSVTQLLGISLDEAHRMRSPDRPCYINEYPLIDRNMTRLDCLMWLQREGFPRPPKSSCVGCPYHSNEQWRSLTKEEFAEAVQFERTLQANEKKRGSYSGTLWLHRSCKPLDTVDLSPSDQTDMFGNECMGLCGT